MINKIQIKNQLEMTRLERRDVVYVTRNVNRLIELDSAEKMLMRELIQLIVNETLNRKVG